MSSLREDVLAALGAAIAAAVGTAAAVYRTRLAPVAREEGAVIILRPDEETVEAISQFRVRRDLTFSLTVIMRDGTPDRAADSLLATVHGTVMADQTVGGRVARVLEVDTKWDLEVADQAAAAIVLRYTARYLTPHDALTAVP